MKQFQGVLPISPKGTDVTETSWYFCSKTAPGCRGEYLKPPIGSTQPYTLFQPVNVTESQLVTLYRKPVSGCKRGIFETAYGSTTPLRSSGVRAT